MNNNCYWIITLASIIGVIANIHKKQWCFAIWLITNAVWCVHDFTRGEYYQSALFGVYFCLSIWGVAKWSKA